MDFKNYFQESSAVKHRYKVTNVYVRGSRVSGEVITTSEASALGKLVVRHLDRNQAKNPGPHIAKAKELRGYTIKDEGIVEEPRSVSPMGAWYQESTHTEHAVKHVPKSGKELPDDVNAAFNGLANDQRGLPESAMMAATMFHHGVWAFCLEHIGDLTHRMAQDPKFYNGGQEYVDEKVRKCLRYIFNEYGFEREVKENIKGNYEHSPNGMTFKQYMSKTYDLAKAYAQEHMKLPVYNLAHWYARQAAIDMGLAKFNEAGLCLTQLRDRIQKGVWSPFALTYYTDQNGKILPYTHDLEDSPVGGKIS